MAKHAPVTRPDVLREIIRRLQVAEAGLAALSRRAGTTLDRGNTAEFAAPSEGQVMIEAADERVKYFANQEWRVLGSGVAGPWTSPPALLHGWAFPDPPKGPCMFRWNSGELDLRGGLDGAAMSTPHAFTLPPDFWQPFDIDYVTPVETLTGFVVAHVRISSTDGHVTIVW